MIPNMMTVSRLGMLRLLLMCEQAQCKGTDYVAGY